MDLIQFRIGKRDAPKSSAKAKQSKDSAKVVEGGVKSS